MKLKDYFEVHKMTQVDFCKANDLSRETIRKIINGEIPNMETAFKIFNGTRGQVTPSDLGIKHERNT